MKTYLEPGSIEPPRIIGRIVRLLLGIICLDLVWQIIDDIPGMIERGWPVNFVSICTIALGFYLIKPVVNLGFSIKWAWLVQLSILTITLLTLGLVWQDKDSQNWEYITAWLMLWMTYVYGHLGLSFVLSAIIKTPGCEMRSIPHLWGILSGNKSLEHHCPGFIKSIDRWESKLNINK